MADGAALPQLLRLSAMAKRIGFSKRKLRDDVDRGHLRVHWVTCGSSKMAMVDQAEAARYLREIGISTSEATQETAPDRAQATTTVR